MIATIIGVIISIQRLAPVYGLAMSWALLSVADSLKQRMKRDAKKKADGNGKEVFVGLQGAKTQLRLSCLGAFVCLSASTFVYLRKIKPTVGLQGARSQIFLY